MAKKAIKFIIIVGLLYIIILPIFGLVLCQNPILIKIENFQKNWKEMEVATKTNLATLPRYDEFPENTTSWSDYAEKCFEELLIFDECWINETSINVTGFRPYVKKTDGWGGEDRTREITELMASMDVLWPMYRYIQLHPDETRENLIKEFIDELPKYYNPQTQQATNRPGENKHDSWYFMENSVLKYGHLFMISGISSLRNPYFGSLSSGIEMAHNFNYLFPQFVNLNKEEAFGYNTVNYCTAGLLAYSLINAYELTQDISYLKEAETTLIALRKVTPPFMTLYEPQELAAAVAASAKMIEYSDLINSTVDFVRLSMDFFYAQEQMVYYNKGKTALVNFNPQTSEWLPSGWRDGLHSPYYNPSELGGINAPAFKENGESIMFWTAYLKYLYGNVPEFNAEEPLKVLNLNRIKNFYFFSPNIPDAWERDFGPRSLQFIPYEDIDYYAVREYENESVRYFTGYNGKEIYGAGETIWSYLLFEALGESSDRNALIINLNIFDKEYPGSAENRGYIVFNPYNKEKTLSFTLKQLNGPYTLYANRSLLGKFQPEESFNITLPPGGSAYLTINVSSLVSFIYNPGVVDFTSSSSLPQTTSPSPDSLAIVLFIISSMAILTVLILYSMFSHKKIIKR
ncbi:MAG: hypothetical protein ACFFB2_04975 [Promethearchaeota archaeon]